ncbi:HAD family hydrolase [Candidatus Sumerlaeota bacterium]|nr:HAD family hydrolase [Candidatus Sumerlaeota bacterium]
MGDHRHHHHDADHSSAHHRHRADHRRLHRHCGQHPSHGGDPQNAGRRSLSLRCAIFDLDQTVATTAGLLYGSWNAAMAAISRDPWTPEQIIELFGPSEHVALRQTVGEDEFAVAMDAYLRHYHTHHGQVRVYEGIEGLLQGLRGRGVFLGMVTGKGRATTEITLTLTGLRGLFDLVLTGDELSRPKPAPEGIERILRAAGCSPSETVMIGDMPNDVLAAHAAGVEAVAALWDCEWPEELRASGPHHVFETVEALSDWLLT